MISVEPQDLALAIADPNRKVFDSAAHQPSFLTRNPTGITASPADLTICLRRRPTASSSVSDGASTKVASVSQIESVLASCQPSLLHLLPILEELGVRRSEHMAALARMREQTRDREVKEEALKKGVTVVEWAILIDKLQSL